MILIGLGANLGEPKESCLAALKILEKHPLIEVARVSRWYKTAPVPVSDQPWYVNGAAGLETSLSAEALLAFLHDVEAEFGRLRRVRNEARTLDLDLLAYGDRVSEEGAIRLPHPRLAERAFVLMPLSDIAPDWRHPVTGKNVACMLKELPAGQKIEALIE